MDRPNMIMVDGKPVSEWDITGQRVYGTKLPPGYHYILKPHGFSAVSSEELYDVDRTKPGRPLMFSLSEARAIKEAYWTGARTITELAREYGTTRVTISRIVHGKIMWYA